MVRNYHVAGVVTDGTLKVLFSEDEARLKAELGAAGSGMKIPVQTAASGEQVETLAREWQAKYGCASFGLEEVGAVRAPLFGTLERTAAPAARTAAA